MSIQAILPRALDANGNPAPGAKAWFYNTGTTTAQTVYSDTALSTAHTQPVVADSNGVFPQVFGVGATALKVVLTNAAEVALPEGTIDPVPTSTISTSTAGSIPFTPTAGIAQTNVQDAIEEVYTDSLQNVVEDTAPQLGGPLDANSNQVRAAKGVDVASAAALTLGNDGNSFDITGTTSITSIATKGVGTMVTLHFDDVLTLTHHATDLILPTGANITTAAGDIAVFYEYASGDWRCVSYTRADGTALAISQGIRAWALFNGTGTPSLTGGFNIASITDNGVGDYTVNFTNALASGNYCVQLTVKQNGTGNSTFAHVGTRATGSVQVLTKSNTSGENAVPAPYDADEIHVTITQ